MKMFSIRDRLSKLFGAPFTAKSPYDAMRGITHDLSKNPQHPMVVSHADFELCQLNDFNEESGLFVDDGFDLVIVCPISDLVPRKESAKDEA